MRDSPAHTMPESSTAIKPDNIMMDRHGVLKLLDFGIARNAHAESTHQMTQPGMIMGTYNYMSPEQLLGKMVDNRRRHLRRGCRAAPGHCSGTGVPGAFGSATAFQPVRCRWSSTSRTWDLTLVGL